MEEFFKIIRERFQESAGSGLSIIGLIRSL